jgi:hypothetical protein
MPGGNTSAIDINTTTMVPISATATVVPSAGTWKLGFCASTLAATHKIDRDRVTSTGGCR